MKESLKFRPSARLIRTVGDEIIKDVYAAVIELIKNAYDADANNVELKFIDLADIRKAKIIELHVKNHVGGKEMVNRGVESVVKENRKENIQNV